MDLLVSGFSNYKYQHIIIVFISMTFVFNISRGFTHSTRTSDFIIIVLVTDKTVFLTIIAVVHIFVRTLKKNCEFIQSEIKSNVHSGLINS